jgi:transglutaminase-like putative cysteine protease
MRLHILHRTAYRYAAAASYSIQVLKLTPRREAMQRALSWRVGTPGRRVEQLDAFGNLAHLLTLEGPHSEVIIQAEGVVETDDACDGYLPADGGLSPLAYVACTPLTQASEAIGALAARVFGGAPATAGSARRLMEEVAESVRYQPGSTQVSDSASDVMQRGAGVCQDQAHVAIAVCRAAGVPARYVSGHILTDEQHAASHAWADVWLADEDRWLSCDLTHRQPAGARLCRIAVGRDYLDAAPVRGMRRGGGREQLDVQVLVSDAPLVAADARHAMMLQQTIQQ